jgi:curli biogenesis system outer membrane secretion channel CsgG
MRKYFLLTVSVLYLFGAAGCASITQPAAQVDTNAGTSPLPPYSGPKARIAVADFEVKAAKATGEIGDGLREMLVTALLNSSRFSVLERQALKAVMQEQELAVSGAAQQGSGPQTGNIKTADLIITAAVTEFEPQASGGKAGIGGGGGLANGVLGGLLGAALNKAHIRIIDTSTSEVVAATRVQGQASDVAGGFMAGFMGSWALGGGLSAYANTPMEKAIRVCIIEAVRYITQTTPACYFRYENLQSSAPSGLMRHGKT